MFSSLMRSAVAVINHLLAEESWAQELLVTHRAKTICIDGGPGRVFLTVTGDGFLESAAVDAVPAVTIRFRLADLPLILLNRERAVSYMKIEGDADFANTISQLSQSLRWDTEEDLSKIVGDIAATRIVASAKSMMAAMQTMQRQFAEHVAEYFLEEQPMLIRPHLMTEFSSGVVKLRDDLERLSKRIEKLERR